AMAAAPIASAAPRRWLIDVCGPRSIVPCVVVGVVLRCGLAIASEAMAATRSRALDVAAARRRRRRWTIRNDTACDPMRRLGPDRGQNGDQQCRRQHPTNDDHLHFVQSF